MISWEAPPTAAFLLTSNPNRWKFDEDELAGFIEATRAGSTVEFNWSTGGTSKKISVGDRPFLMLQGVPNRGIFASGRFVSRVYQGPHYRDPKPKTSNYADIVWDRVLDPQDVLPINELQEQLPTAHWEPQASGTQINPAAVPGLEKMWAAHIGSVPPPPFPKGRPRSEGQGRRLDTKLRKQIEDVAQDRLMQHYRSNGWDVEDCRFGNPFDAKATKGDRVEYLEAKGTTTEGKRVIVTRNEVAFAGDHPGECVIGLVVGITLTDTGDLDTTSGELQLFRWEPQDENLDPLHYDYYPPDEHRIDIK